MARVSARLSTATPSTIARLTGGDAPVVDDLRTFLRAGDAGREIVRALLDGVDVISAGTPVEESRLAAPYVPGAKIVCHAVNYPSHAGEVGIGSKPYFFYKPPTSVIGPGDQSSRTRRCPISSISRPSLQLLSALRRETSQSATRIM